MHSPAALQQALAADDVDALCLVPGVGKKTATRLLVELKSKLNLPLVDLANLHDGAAPAKAAGVHADVRDALAGLGYSADEIRRVLADLPTDGDPGEVGAPGAAANGGTSMNRPVKAQSMQRIGGRR